MAVICLYGHSSGSKTDLENNKLTTNIKMKNALPSQYLKTRSNKFKCVFGRNFQIVFSKIINYPRHRPEI